MREELSRIAARALDAAREYGVQCEAFVQKKGYTSVMVEGGKVSFGSRDGDYGVGVRVINDKRVGFAYCDENSIDFGIKQAIAVSKYGKAGNYAFPGPSSGNGTRTIYDNRIATLVAEDGIEIARDMIEGASFDKRSLASRGGLSYGTVSMAIANTNGLTAFDEGTSINGSMFTVLKDGDMVVNGHESEISRSMDIDFEKIGRMSTEKALSQIGPKSVQSDTMTVIMRPEALYEIVSVTVLPSLFGGAVKKGESVYAGRVGKQVIAKGISIVDDGTHPKGMNTYLTDEEGTPSRRNVLVDNGILKGFLYDAFSALDCGAHPTSSAMRFDRWEPGTSFKHMPSTCPRNIVLEGETMSEEEMIMGVKNGIVVDHVLGAHTANKSSGDFSVAVYMGSAIKDGEVIFPLKGGMIGGNMPEMLMNAALANNYKWVESGESPGCGYIPSVMFKDVKVSSD